MPVWNMPQIKLNLQNWSKKVIPAAVVSLQKMIAFELFKKIIMRTPVDKGFLRGAWTISLQKPDYSKNKKELVASSAVSDQAPISAEEQGKLDSILSALQELEVGQIVWLANAMPYVERIEYEGWSKRHPSGMVMVSLAEIEIFIKQLEAKFK